MTEPAQPATALPERAASAQTEPDAREAIRQDPIRFGVGARVTVAVMSDDYAEVILVALRDLDASGLEVTTTDVSTCVQGEETAILRWLTELGERIAETGRHAAMTVLLTRGCPGETRCELPGDAGPRPVEAPAGRELGRYATADWVLYPLADAPLVDGQAPDHMRDIWAAIEFAQARGVFDGEQHFASRLAGDLGTLLEVAVAGWTMTGRSVQHVTSHLTLSLNSPSHAPNPAQNPAQDAAATGAADSNEGPRR